MLLVMGGAVPCTASLYMVAIKLFSKCPGECAICISRDTGPCDIQSLILYSVFSLSVVFFSSFEGPKENLRLHWNCYGLNLKAQSWSLGQQADWLYAFLQFENQLTEDGFIPKGPSKIAQNKV